MAGDGGWIYRSWLVWASIEQSVQLNFPVSCLHCSFICKIHMPKEIQEEKDDDMVKT